MSLPSDETLFAAALARPAAERPAFLDAACAGDAAQRARVAGLLSAHENAEQHFMATAAPAAPRALAEPAAGMRIGRYKLLQKLGEGGCGIVYTAEQEEPVRRRVALKVIKLGMDTKEVIARFEAERQALALMDHPNIARVFDGGATETGRPYFVMELVRGVPITKFCDEQNLPTRARLELFTQVCHAVQHAHQKGIIHRDLKPSNILVTLHDGVPVPKVIDFGIAKATQGRLTDATLFTAFEQFIGTPAYMSPEQAELSGLDIDTRSDIYSLGVLLYELLTGRPPFDPKSLLSAGLDEIRRIIREVDPPRPSTRLSTLTDADRVTIAKQRGLAPAQLSTLLRGDLDWIVMRCLEKDRTRRYETANGLALDVQRHLHDEAVTACPPSATYRVRKLIRRNRFACTAGAAVTVALLAGLSVSTWAYLRERRAREFAVRAATSEQGARERSQAALSDIADVRRAARASEQRAEQAAARSDQAVQLLKQLLAASAVENASHARATWIATLAAAAERMSADSNLSSNVREEFLEVFGDAYMGWGEFAGAEQQFRALLALRRARLGPAHADIDAALQKLLRALERQGRPRDVQRESDAAREYRRKYVRDHHLGANRLARYARDLRQAGQFAESEAYLWELIDHPEVTQSLKHRCLGEVAQLRFAAGHLEIAQRLALRWLATEKEHRSLSRGVLVSFGATDQVTIYQANSLLGRIALYGGDTRAARDYLLAAGNLDGARNYVVTRGLLDFSLPVELLRAGERETVLQFLRQMERFYVESWERHIADSPRASEYDSAATGQKHAGLLMGWRQAVAENRVPQEWEKRVQPPPQTPPVALPPIMERLDRSAFAALMERLVTLEISLVAQLLAWLVAVTVIARRTGVSVLLPTRAARGLIAFGIWRVGDSLVALALHGGAGSALASHPKLVELLMFLPIIAWFILWETAIALRECSKTKIDTVFMRSGALYLTCFLVLLIVAWDKRTSVPFTILAVIAAVFSCALAVASGASVAVHLWHWARRIRLQGWPAFCIVVTAPLWFVQGLTSVWEVLTIADFANPMLARGLIFADSLLPCILTAAFLGTREFVGQATLTKAAQPLRTFAACPQGRSEHGGNALT